MLSKCANPACSAAFRFLHEGRIFSLVRKPGGEPSSEAGIGNGSQLERYWLCDRCAQAMTLVWSRGAVVLKALPGVVPPSRHALRPLPPAERTLAA